LDHEGALRLAIRQERYDLVGHLVSPGATIDQAILTELVEDENVDAIRALSQAGASFCDGEGKCPALQLALNKQKLALEMEPEFAAWDVPIVDFQKFRANFRDIVSLILQTLPNVDGIVIYDLVEFSADIHRWLKCDGIGSVHFWWGEDPSATDFESLLLLAVESGRTEPGVHELVRMLTHEGVNVLKDTGFLVDLLEARKVCKDESIMNPLVSHSATHLGITPSSLWGALRASPAELLELLRMHGAPSEDSACRLLFKYRRVHEEPVVSQILNLNRKYDFDSYYPASLDFNESLWSGVRINKLLAEHIKKVPRYGLYYDTDPQGGYIFLMDQMMDPRSELFANKLLPKRFALRFQGHDKVSKTTSFRFLSTCAAAATVLGTGASEGIILRELVAEGLRRCEPNNGGQLRIHDLCVEYNQAFDGLFDVRDMMTSFAHTVLIPLLAYEYKGVRNLPRISAKNFDVINEALRDVSFDVLFNGRSLLEISRINRAWHRVIDRHPVGIHEQVEWHPIIPETPLSEGYSVIALTTPAQLKSEGQAMGNCLVTGLYDAGCMCGDIAILSLRYQGVPVVTLTLVNDPDSDKWLITEYQGARHAAPSYEERNQISLLRRMLNDGSILVGSQGVGLTEQSRKKLNRGDGFLLERLCGRRLGDYPEAAIAFYSHAVRWPTHGEMIPLLQDFYFDRYKDYLYELLESC
jgi:hypothetical protein